MLRHFKLGSVNWGRGWILYYLSLLTFFLHFPCVGLSCILAALFDTNVLCTKCSWEALDGSSFTNFWSISLQIQFSFPGGIFPHIIISGLTSSAAKPLSHFCLYSYAEICRKIPISQHWRVLSRASKISHSHSKYRDINKKNLYINKENTLVSDDLII